MRKVNLLAEKQSQIVSAAMSRCEFEPLRNAMLTAIPRAGALRGGVPLHRKQSGAYSAQVVEADDEEDEEDHVLETNEASDDELEAEYQEAEALMAEQKWAERDSSFENLSSSRNFHVRDVGNWAIGKTIMIARPK